MKILQKSIASALLLAGLSFSSAAVAQNRVGAATQQGNGAFVAKENTVFCMPNTMVKELTGVTLAADGCTNFTTLRYNITPSGNSKSVITAVLPEGSRPTQQTTYNATYTEHVQGPTFGKVYDTVAVIEPDGKVTISGVLKGKGKMKIKG